MLLKFPKIYSTVTLLWHLKLLKAAILSPVCAQLCRTHMRFKAIYVVSSHWVNISKKKTIKIVTFLKAESFVCQRYSCFFFLISQAGNSPTTHPTTPDFQTMGAQMDSDICNKILIKCEHQSSFKTSNLIGKS